ncbi:hypothetical protein BBF96_09655 [Anoxybacter fermentans]|uniref:Gas vesicle protein n=1 Tax=Anoxybacter fermentans TaxID=1323375 RepID=A0A3Q9HQQ5_9FIRM|nr:hypothetical protein [Anoxybacter fermentans]AZR73628.1 hypothetical protein BBF96_09655 [Anoxybacter fermentans]
MRGGFFRGLIVGTVIGTISGMLMGPEYRDRAREFFNQGGHMLKRAQEGLETANNLINRGRQILQPEKSETGEDGKENIARRVAVLEKRLEELSQKGV